MSRVVPTPDNVSNYLERVVNESNYHLFYGIHLLDRDRAISVFDGLLNGDFQPEELNRLGGFTNVEADEFLQGHIGYWVGVGKKDVGSNGYSYLTRTLNLDDVLREASLAKANIAPHRVAGIYIPIGGLSGYQSVESIHVLFNHLVMPDILDSVPVETMFPATVLDLKLIYNNQLWSLWSEQVFSPLIVGNSSPVDLLIGIGSRPSVFAQNPGLLQWVLEEPRPSPRMSLLVRREASTRSTLSNPVYTVSEMYTLIDEIEKTVLSPDGTSRLIAELDFKCRLLNAIPNRPIDITNRLNVAIEGLNMLFAYRDRLRNVLERMLMRLPTVMVGQYPVK